MANIPLSAFDFIKKNKKYYFNEIFTRLCHDDVSKNKNNVSNALKKYVSYGYFKKTTISKNRTYYERMIENSNEYYELLDELILEYKKSLDETLNVLKNKTIFIKINKKTLSYKTSRYFTTYEKLVEQVKDVNKLYMILLWQQDQIQDDERKKRLHEKSTLIKKLVNSTLEDRKSVV